MWPEPSEWRKFTTSDATRAVFAVVAAIATVGLTAVVVNRQHVQHFSALVALLAVVAALADVAWWLCARPAHLATKRFNRGLALVATGDNQGAQLAYRGAIAAGHPQLWASAAINLGRLARDDGDTAQARLLFERVIEHSHDDAGRRKASFNAGIIYLEERRPDLAEVAFRWSLTGHSKALNLLATLRLTNLLIGQGRTDEAVVLVLDAAEWAPIAVNPLGGIALARNAYVLEQISTATDLYQKIVALGDPMQAAIARCDLAYIRIGAAEYQQGLEEARYVVDSGPAESHGRAQHAMGIALIRLGDPVGGLRAWQQAMTDPAVRPYLIADMGEQLLRTGDVAGARVLLEEANEAPHNPDHAAVAAASLGQIRALDGDIDAARELWNQAIASEVPAAASMARVYLARHLLNEGQHRQALALLEMAAVDGPPEVAADAAETLATTMNQHRAVTDPAATRPTRNDIG